MTGEEELIQLKRDKQLAHRDEVITQMQQLVMLSEQLQTLQAQLKKDSRNNHSSLF
jgi:hypothetical protein